MLFNNYLDQDERKTSKGKAHHGVASGNWIYNAKHVFKTITPFLTTLR